MMQVEYEELKGEYKTLLACDGKSKRLFVELNVHSNGKDFTFFLVEVDGKDYSRSATLRDALNIFNRV